MMLAAQPPNNSLHLAARGALALDKNRPHSPAAGYAER